MSIYRKPSDKKEETELDRLLLITNYNPQSIIDIRNFLESISEEINKIEEFKQIYSYRELDMRKKLQNKLPFLIKTFLLVHNIDYVDIKIDAKVNEFKEGIDKTYEESFQVKQELELHITKDTIFAVPYTSNKLDKLNNDPI